MQARLAALEEYYRNLEEKLSNPEIINQQDLWRKLSKEHAALTETVDLYRRYKKVTAELADTKEMLAKEKNDPEMESFLREEQALLQKKARELEQELQLLLLPRDPNDEKDVIVEIRAGAGGDEAGLFAADLLRMYTRYAERCNWKTEILQAHATDIGGFKEVVFSIQGKGAFSRLKFERGVHRVQRIPTTESGGRIHTSTATVAVLPEAEEVEVEINQQDLRVDTFCSTGPGGQSVNTTQSAVRITHIPTGIVVSCQDEKSQHKNRERAMRVLRARLLAKVQSEQQQELAEQRRSQVGTGDRSERIRTYNFPQNRVTDHRIGLSLHRLEAILDGDLDEMINSLISAERAEQLKQAQDSAAFNKAGGA